MNGHPGAELLARFAQGDLRAWRARRVRSHLDGCPDCSATMADLGHLRRTLVSAAPPGLPPVVAARLDAALAAAVAERAAATGTAGTTTGRSGPARGPGIHGRPASARPGSAGPGRRERASGRSGRFASPVAARGLVAAAAAAVVLAGGGLLLSRFSGASPGTPATASSGSSGLSGGARHADSRAGGNVTAGTAAPAGAAGPRPAVPGTGTSGVLGSLPYSRNGAPATTELVISTQNLDPATLPAQVRLALAQQAYNLEQGKMAPGAGPDLARLTGGAFSAGTLGACVSRISAGSDVRLVETARYRGSPAAIIVSAGSPAAGVLGVTVVGPGCSATNSAVIARTVISAGN